MSLKTGTPEVPTQPDEPVSGVKAGSRGRRFRLDSSRWTAVAIFLPPALLLFTVFVILPVGESIYYSFAPFRWNGYGPPVITQLNFGNYIRTFNDPIFWSAFVNNLLVVAVSAFIQVPLALILALLIADRRPSNLFFRGLFFVPYILADIVAGLIFRYLFDGEYGLAGQLADVFHFPVRFWLGERGWATAALLIVVTWKYFGFHMALFIAGRQNVPDDVIESATIDGARQWQITRHIVLPLMRPVVFLSLFFAILGSFQLFDVIIPLTGGGPLDSSHSVVSYLYTFGIKRMRLGFGSAVGTLLFLWCVMVMIFYKRFLLRPQGNR
ncbi:MAG: sugar ABC transporter permease [Verrucomicrobia bacterium]|nr:sugar ABC transporter permease [Verrucomicrobiota bacterium]